MVRSVANGQIQINSDSNNSKRTKTDSTNASSSSDIKALSIGALAVDMTCNLNSASLDNKSTWHSSHPGSVQNSVGGVAHNVALAASYRGLSGKVKLVSEIAESDKTILDSLSSHGIVTSGIKLGDRRTGRYIAMHDKAGHLMVACADMETIETLDVHHISEQIKNSPSKKVVVFDGNLNLPQMKAVVDTIAENRETTVTAFEPTSVPRGEKLARIKNLGVFPNNTIDLITPNNHELEGIFAAFRREGKFDVENWFPIIDALKVQDSYNRSIEVFARSHPDLANLIKDGVAQQSLQLLPYVPNIIVKSGSKGVVSFQLVADASKIPKEKVQGIICIGNKKLDVGIVIQHFPVTKVEDSLILSVTGAGDTLMGSLVADIALEKWDLSPGSSMKESIDRAQACSALTIQSSEAVNPDIAGL